MSGLNVYVNTNVCGRAESEAFAQDIREPLKSAYPGVVVKVQLFARATEERYTIEPTRGLTTPHHQRPDTSRAEAICAAAASKFF